MANNKQSITITFLFYVSRLCACYGTNHNAIKLKVFQLKRAFVESYLYIVTMLLKMIFSQIYNFIVHVYEMLILNINS